LDGILMRLYLMCHLNPFDSGVGEKTNKITIEHYYAIFKPTGIRHGLHLEKYKKFN